MQSISKLRFDALAGYIRRPEALLVSEELEWYSEGNDRIVAVIIRDTVDDDFTSVILGRDKKGRFRAVHLLTFSQSVEATRAELQPAMREWSLC